MVQIDIQFLQARLHAYVVEHDGINPDIAQLDFLASLKHPEANPIALTFINLVAVDTLPRLRKHSSELVPQYEQLLIIDPRES